MTAPRPLDCFSCQGPKANGIQKCLDIADRWTTLRNPVNDHRNPLVTDAKVNAEWSWRRWSSSVPANPPRIAINNQQGYTNPCASSEVQY